MLNCEITVRGNSVGRYGRSKNDKTGPVRKFVVGNEYLYKQVFNHVKDCKTCSPTEVLKIHLARRISQNGTVAAGLAKLALRYLKKMPDRTDLGVVKQILSRECHKILADNCEIFTSNEIAMIARRLREQQTYAWDNRNKLGGGNFNTARPLFNSLTNLSGNGPRTRELLSVIKVFFGDPPTAPIGASLPDDDQEILNVALVGGIMMG